MSGDLDDRAIRFVRALEVAPLGVSETTTERTERGVRVIADVPGPLVNRAQSIAAGHGFQLYGKVGEDRYAFEAHSRSAFDWELPGGVR